MPYLPPGLVAQSAVCGVVIRWSRIRSPVGYFFFMKINHEIISKVIFSLPLIQEGLLSVSGKRICASTG